MTYEEQEAARKERLAEVGTLPGCPLCGAARVARSDYVRCNGCGVNWMDGENLDRDPRAERWEKVLASARSMKGTG